ncbi:trace amine-associated receptor 13c-like [Puntigrus tetrazona]|uniref:trace amine-associated receptor 13c-like n=1 Tax=Puntigrus tetrazona TaxID=1606681 RepID=UPI001C8929CC|nr:trace amine-associated receptor 13c-like [Puntigrus tetrazona]
MAYETEDHETQYCFPAINSSCIKGKRSRHEYNIMYVFFSLLSAWTVFLNLLVIISISHFKKLHTPTNLIILSLAVADLLIGLIVMPVDAIKLIETCWYIGDTACRLFLIIMGLLLSASLSNLVLIAIDRYVAVCHPLQYTKKITTTKTLISICVCWFCSTVYNSAGLSYGSVDMLHKSDTCYGECPLVMSFALGVIDVIISFLFPCTLIITLYLRIFYVVHQHVKVINSLMKSGKCEMKGSVKRKSESKAALTLGIIVTVHLLCWIPYYISYLTKNRVSSATSDFLTWCLYINSCLNPLIYALFYPWFRISVKYILSLQIFKPASSLVNVLPDNHL